MNIERIKGEMERYGMTELHRQTGISRSNLYGILNGSIEPKLSTFDKILNCLGYRINIVASDEELHDLNDSQYFQWSLAHYGAPLMVDKKFKNPPDVNNLLLKALEVGRIEAEINTIIPIFIFNNQSKFNWELIISKTKERAYLGYMLNLIDNIKNIPALAGLHSKIYREYGPKKKEFLLKKKRIGIFEKSKAQKNENKIADTWKFLTLDSFSDIETRFYKWT